MALIEMFQDGDTESQREALTNVLDNGLLVAEGKGRAFSSSEEDLSTQFTRDRALEPTWLNTVNPELALVYRKWLEENRLRVEAVIKGIY